MFELQASRFVELDEHGEELVHDLHRRAAPGDAAAAPCLRCGARSCLGYRAEPRLLIVLARSSTVLMMLPGRCFGALWLEAARQRRARGTDRR